MLDAVVKWIRVPSLGFEKMGLGDSNPSATAWDEEGHLV